MLKLTDKQIARMLKAVPMECPYCQSTQLTLVEPRFKKVRIETTILCETCGSKWGAAFKLSSVWGRSWDV